MRILLVEDETALAESLAEGLRGEGHVVDVAGDGLAALQHLLCCETHLVILDRDLPLLSGDDVCERARASGLRVPILMLTAASGVADRVVGLDLGADDYLTKPFAYVELLARIRALGRRSGPHVAEVLEWGDIRLTPAKKFVERGASQVALTAKEYGVLEMLLSADGGFVTTSELLEEVWGSCIDHSRGVVKSAVYTLRQKLGHPDPIEAVSGRGYLLRPLP